MPTKFITTKRIRAFGAVVAACMVIPLTPAHSSEPQLTCDEEREALAALPNYGVYQSIQGRVTYLGTGAAGRKGNIDWSSLAKLTALRRLSVSYTEHDPRWARHIAGLWRLESLGTFYGGLSDDDLKHFAGLENLRTLSIEVSAITDAGVEHLLAIESLEDLHLKKADITDAGLARLGTLPRLRRLVLTGTKITPQGIAVLSDTKIEAFACDAGSKSEQLPYLKLLKNLKSLDVYYQGITDADLKHVAEMTKLEKLNIGKNPIGDAGLAELTSLKQLRELNLNRIWKASKHPYPDSAPAFTDKGLAAVAQLGELRRLSLEGAEITPQGLAQLSSLAHLEFIEITNTPLIHAGKIDLRGCKCLKEVSAYNFDEALILVPEGCAVTTFD